MNDLLITNFD